MIVFYGALIASVLAFLAVCAWYTDKVEERSNSRAERINKVRKDSLDSLQDVNRKIIKLHINA